MAHQKNGVKVLIQFFNCTPCLLIFCLPNGMDSRSANCHHYMLVVVKECVLYAYHAIIGYHRLEVVRQIRMIVNAYIFKFVMSMQNWHTTIAQYPFTLNTFVCNCMIDYLEHVYTPLIQFRICMGVFRRFANKYCSFKVENLAKIYALFYLCKRILFYLGFV